MTTSESRYRLLVIGGSAGSLAVVLNLLPLIKRGSGLAIILIFHRKHTEESTLVEVLSRKTEFFVKEADDKDVLESDTIYVAPSDYHILIEKDHTLTLDDSEKVNHSRPSIDVTFESAADIFGSSLACLLLSGANADGVAGLRYAKSKGALLLVQDPETAEVPYMPRQATDSGLCDFLVNGANILDSPLFSAP